uniref:Potassium-transporting ATPase A chain (Potassium-translocating ATPase A chain) (ATP phosphohydrolase (Potassium-transporting) A chain) (Potassium-binding and translocating subunit A) n=1 Tax=mine drainage metagenome TaxID=410659 RepID=E6Q6B9_9ZZZZ
MTLTGWLQAIIIFAVLVACTKPLGTYMFAVFTGERTWLTPLFAPVERLLYRIAGVRADEAMDWRGYTLAMLGFSLVGFAYLYALLLTQGWLPLNPQHFPNLSPGLAWNTAISFLTNTNWQFYSGESTMSYLSQMAGLAWHNFVSAGVGIAIAVAVIRGFAAKGLATLGNFWVDLTRACLYILLPIAALAAIVLAAQGVPQNFNAYRTVTTLAGGKQTITGGPMASQEAIKELGTNGGGFVNANSASPNENPTPISNALEILLILLIAAGLTYTYGKMVGDTRQGWAIFTAMFALFWVGFAIIYHAEAAGNPLLHHLAVRGGNMEGKETRFAIAGSSLFIAATTGTSTGAVNASIDSFMPIGGLVALLNLQLGEIAPGGVGSGLYAMLEFVVLTVFIAGLMVGRTPELLGKKIERREVQLAILAILVTPIFVLIPTAIAALLPAGSSTLGNAGPHGFSEILYAFSSSNANNGSAFAGLGGDRFYYIATGISMFFGRFFVAIPMLALAGSLAGKRPVAAGAGTFSTASPTFILLLLGTILIVGALTFLPADALGPIADHYLLHAGRTF